MLRTGLASTRPSTRVFGVRGMATEKQILMRITSTTNIAKITKSMKMVSASKMRGAQNRLNEGRPFAGWLDNLSGKPIEIEKDGNVPMEKIGDKNLMVVISSDRGLCGGCNSYVAKATRSQGDAMMAEKTEVDVFIVGEKGRSQLRRFYAPKILGHVTECWQTPPSFSQATAVAEGVLACGEYDATHIVFNKFQSAITYLTSVRSLVTNPRKIEGAEEKPFDDAMIAYEFEPDNREEVMADLLEFQLATGIFHGMIESATSEQSSRMAAMENATNNAQDLVKNLTLVYNKARQTRITTELVEIISGAASLDG